MNGAAYVIDCGNGAAGIIAPELLKRLGCEVFTLFCEVDGNFPNHHPDPSVPENLADLQAAVREHGAHLGIALDATRNAGAAGKAATISRDGSPVAVLVIPTDEESEIARQAMAVVAGK